MTTKKAEALFRNDAMKKIIDKYNVNIQDAYAIEEKEYRPKTMFC